MSECVHVGVSDRRSACVFSLASTNTAAACTVCGCIRNVFWGPAFEFLDDDAMRVTTSNLSLDNPLGASSPFYILIETHGSVQDHDQAKLEVRACASTSGCAYN